MDEKKPAGKFLTDTCITNTHRLFTNLCLENMTSETCFTIAFVHFQMVVLPFLHAVLATNDASKSVQPRFEAR